MNSWRLFSMVRLVIPFFAGILSGELYSSPGFILTSAISLYLAGLVVLAITTKLGFLVPKDIWEFPDKKIWPKDWISVVEKKIVKKIPVWKALLPYFLVGVLLALSRLRELPFGSFLKKVSFNLGINNIFYSFTPFYSPGFLFLVVCFSVWLLFGLKKKEIFSSVNYSFRRLFNPLIALIFAVACVQIIMNSGTNLSNSPSMPVVIGNLFESFGALYVFFAPFVGLFGSFISGSNTVSNLLMGPFQLGAASALNLSSVLILSLQTVGGAIGNMIAVHNIIAVCAVVGIVGQEGRIIRFNLVPCLFYALLVGLLALLMF